MPTSKMDSTTAAVIDDTFERRAGLLQQPAAVQTLLLGEGSQP